MPNFPTEKELLDSFSYLFENKEIIAVSTWNETNFSEPTDEETYLSKAIKNISSLKGKLTATLDSI